MPGEVRVSLLAPIASPFDLVHVALDLETTGLDSSRDTIIEIGAVKFQGDRQIDSFQTFVNPGRPIPDHIQRLTHISPHQVERAPMFGSIADDLAAFIGDHPVIGHNVRFDVGFWLLTAWPWTTPPMTPGTWPRFFSPAQCSIP